MKDFRLFRCSPLPLLHYHIKTIRMQRAIKKQKEHILHPIYIPPSPQNNFSVQNNCF